jgi:hypothetical protein
MTNLSCAPLFALLAAASAMHAIAPDKIGRSAAVQMSFDVAPPEFAELPVAPVVTALDDANATRCE